MKNTCFLLVAALSLPLLCHAQDTTSPDASIRLLLALSSKDGQEDMGAVYLASLLSALASNESLDAIRVFPESYLYGDANSERLLSDYAVRGGCRLILGVELEHGGERVTARWKIRDIVLKKTLPEKSLVSEIPDAPALAEYFWMDLVASVEREAGEEVPQEFMSIVAAPGSVIKGFGKQTLTVPEGGILMVPVSIPHAYTLRISLKGFIPQERNVLVDRPGIREQFDLGRMPEWAFELGMYNMQFPGFRAQWRPTRDIWFVRAGFEQYILGIVLIESNYDTYSVTTPLYGGIPLFMLAAGAGIDLNPLDTNLGFYFAFDVFLRFFLPAWKSLALEPLAPLGLRPAFGAEYRGSPDFSVFLEIGSLFYPTADTLLLEQSQNTNGPKYGIPLSPEIYLEFFSFRAGFRWRLP